MKFLFYLQDYTMSQICTVSESNALGSNRHALSKELVIISHYLPHTHRLNNNYYGYTWSACTSGKTFSSTFTPISAACIIIHITAFTPSLAVKCKCLCTRRTIFLLCQTCACTVSIFSTIQKFHMPHKTQKILINF